MTHMLIVVIPLLLTPLDEAILRYKIEQALRPREYKIHTAVRVVDEDDIEAWNEDIDEPVYEINLEPLR